MIFILGVTIIVSTLIGFVLSYVFRDRMHALHAFSATALIASALLILLPESLELLKSNESHFVFILTCVGFFGTFLLTVLFAKMFSHTHTLNHAHNHTHTLSHTHEHSHDHERTDSSEVTAIAPVSVIVHGLIDGLASGTAWVALQALAIPVVLAIVIHRVVDGLTVGPIVIAKKSYIKTWITLTVLSPLLGIVLSSFITVSETLVGICLSILAGVFLYIGASLILPETKHSHSKVYVIIGMCVALVLVYVLTLFEAH